MDELEDDGHKSGEKSGECGGKAHRSHCQRAVKDGQSQRTLKSADGGTDELEPAGNNEMRNQADGKQDQQGDDLS